jgi:hypothetical protein
MQEKLDFINHQLRLYPVEIQHEFNVQATKRCDEVFMEMNASVYDEVKHGATDRYVWIDEILEEKENLDMCMMRISNIIIPDYEHNTTEFENAWTESKGRCLAIMKAITHVCV